MSLSQRLTRLPRAFDADLGQAAGDAVPGLSGDLAQLIVGAGGSSPYLNALILREAGWLPAAMDAPEAAVQAECDGLAALAPDQLATGLRRAKQRIALITGLADLAGVWTLEHVTGALTDFAGLACDLAIKAAITPLVRRGKLPGQTEDDIATAGGLVVLAMGKMGAHELNYSSDIDLICLFDETRFEVPDYHDARQCFVKATRAMSAMLSDRTAAGYVFRTDLRLRPDPSVTPVCIAMEAAERYYESLGRTWERAAYIKARPAAGDLAAGDRFLQALNPFVWRRHLDFAAIQDAHDMRLRIRDHKGLGGSIAVPGHDMKLGRGGIREIEFFTQTRQLIAGGRDPDLRCRGTTEGLTALAAKGWLPQDVAETLGAHYRAHREIEHRIQMVNDAQTHKMPKSEDGIERVACLMGQDSATLIAQVKDRLAQVHEMTEGFFAPDSGPVQPASGPDVEMDSDILARWVTYPALRSPRAAQIFERLRPELLSRLSRTTKPDEALTALDRFLAGLPAGVQLFSLFQANPQLIDLLIDIVGTSPALAGYLSRNASVFDAVIGGDFFAEWPGGAALESQLTNVLTAEPDYERQLDATRRWSKEWHFRIGVHYLRGLIDGADAGRQYADLAGAVIGALWPVVIDHFAVKHGPPPGRGAVVLGMGSLGAGRLNATSDLDVIVIYDPAGQDSSGGPRPLAARVYYARLTQAMITAMTAPMAEGRLYDIDMRLRPSGNQGPVATSLTSFRDYQTSQAWAWEHLALTRARVVAGPAELAQEIETFRRQILCKPRKIRDVMSAVVDMRARIAAAKAPAGVWDVKQGAGRLLDIELLAQAGALLSGQSTRDVASGLQGAVANGWLLAETATELSAFYDLFWSVHSAAKLLSGKTIDARSIGQGGAVLLRRITGVTTIEELEQQLETAYANVETLIETALKDGAAHEG
jgi:glutamate-ammonia-ligase adenylyltransferase